MTPTTLLLFTLNFICNEEKLKILFNEARDYAMTHYLYQHRHQPTSFYNKFVPYIALSQTICHFSISCDSICTQYGYILRIYRANVTNEKQPSQFSPLQNIKNRNIVSDYYYMTNHLIPRPHSIAFSKCMDHKADGNPTLSERLKCIEVTN